MIYYTYGERFVKHQIYNYGMNCLLMIIDFQSLEWLEHPHTNPATEFRSSQVTSASVSPLLIVYAFIQKYH